MKMMEMASQTRKEHSKSGSVNLECSDCSGYDQKYNVYAGHLHSSFSNTFHFFGRLVLAYSMRNSVKIEEHVLD